MLAISVQADLSAIAQAVLGAADQLPVSLEESIT